MEPASPGSRLGGVCGERQATARTPTLLEGSEQCAAGSRELAKDPGSRDRWVGGAGGRGGSSLFCLAAAAPLLARSR